ncbi:MAG: PqqD family protein [Verrucomicrobia bacterium]|nr:PqqD family protein [Verrucomicrobiota bacterium]
MLNDQTILRLADDAQFQSLGEGQQTVIVSLNSGALYTCNDTTKSFLQAMDGKKPFGQIIDALASEYEVKREKLHADMTALAEKLVKEKLVVAHA